MSLACCCIWEHVRVQAQWNHSFDVHVNHVGQCWAFLRPELPQDSESGWLLWLMAWRLRHPLFIDIAGNIFHPHNRNTVTGLWSPSPFPHPAILPSWPWYMALGPGRAQVERGRQVINALFLFVLVWWDAKPPWLWQVRAICTERWQWDFGTCVFSLVRAARWGERSSCFNFIITFKMSQSREFPGVPVVKTWAVTTVDSGSIPGWGTKDPTCHAARRKEKQNIPPKSLWSNLIISQCCCYC